MPLLDAERVVQSHEHQVERQQQAAAEVAERPAARRDPVALVGRGDLAQDRVVDDEARAEAEVGDEEQHRAELPVVAGDEEHAARRTELPAQAKPAISVFLRGDGRRRRRRPAGQRREDRGERDDVEDERAGRDGDPEHVEVGRARVVVGAGRPARRPSRRPRSGTARRARWRPSSRTPSWPSRRSTRRAAPSAARTRDRSAIGAGRYRCHVDQPFQIPRARRHLASDVDPVGDDRRRRRGRAARCISAASSIVQTCTCLPSSWARSMNARRDDLDP